MKNVVCFILFLCIVCTLSAGSIGQAGKSGMLHVKTDQYALTFFQGSMFPLEMKSADGTPVPEPSFFDRLVAEDGTQYFLRFDRYAERRILRNDPEQLIVEITGTFCRNEEDEAPGRPKAVYRYECRKGDPAIRVSAHLKREDERNWKEVHFLQPAWKKNPWKFWSKNGAAPVTFRTPKPSYFHARTGILSNGSVRFGLAGKNIVAWNNAANRFVSYLTGGKTTNWKTPELKFEAQILILNDENAE